MPWKTFHHVGLRAIDEQPNESYIPSSQCWVTSPDRHPNRIEFLRYAEDSPISAEFQDAPHIAWEVDDLDAHLEGKELYLAPFHVGEPPFARVAFTIEDGLFTEYMQFVPGRRWFDE